MTPNAKDMANLKTTISGYFTAAFGLAALISAQPDLASWLNPSLAHRVTAFCAFLAAVSHVWGQTKAADANPEHYDNAGEAVRRATLPLIIAAIVPMFLVAGCATNTGDASKDRAGRVTNTVLTIAAQHAGEIALSALANEAKTGFSGDWAASAEQGLYSNMGKIINSDDVAKVLNAWNPAAPAVNSQLALTWKDVNPQTPQDKQAYVAALASSIEGARETTAIVNSVQK